MLIIAVIFADENHIDAPCNLINFHIMSILIMLIVFPCWLLQALNDGGNIK